jgi:AcrR family transcriptional regulator
MALVAGKTKSASPHVLGARVQRERILQAMTEVVAERGFADASVRLVTARAGVSSRTFYECFEGLDDCFTALLELGLEQTWKLIAEEFRQSEQWQDGVLGALASLLVFFEAEPLLTRMWFIESLAAGTWALERRERIVGLLTSMIVEHWTSPKERPEPRASAGVMASVLGLIHTHLVTREPEPLIVLLGPAMGLVTGLYLDTQSVQREIERGEQLSRAIQRGETRWGRAGAAALHTGEDSAAGTLPAALGKPRAHRAWECLLFLAEHPGSSNREIATGIGVAHQSQISRLLALLLDERLIAKLSKGAGKPNAWRLTPQGEDLTSGRRA